MTTAVGSIHANGPEALRDHDDGALTERERRLVADVLVRWTPHGASPIVPGDQDAMAIDRALGRVRREALKAWRGQEVLPTEGDSGSGERWVNAPSS